MNTLVYAHRGASKYAPENTIAAFKKGIEMGAGGIELDVHLTSDGHVVVLHDDLVDRTSNGKGKVSDMSLKQLRELDFGSWFSSEYAKERIPTLEEVLELISDKGIILNIEIKADPNPKEDGIEKKIDELLGKYSMMKKTIISSFNHYTLLKYKKLNPEIKIAPLYVGLLVDVSNYASGINASAIHPSYSSLNEAVIKECKDKGIAVNVWTVDSKDYIKKLALAGADGIITNVPDIAVNVLKNL